MEALLSLQGVNKGFDSRSGRHEVLGDLSLSLREGEIVSVLGFSGSGKSTLIKLVAGLERPDAGVIQLCGAPLTGPGPDRAVVFQNYALLPWLTVTDNVRLAVDAVFPRLTAAERREKVERVVQLVGLTAASGKRPKELSGGMRQRVSVARALAMEPRLLLLDEPFGALDALTRGTLQTELARILTREGRTALMITNDVDEALLLSDRVLVLGLGPAARIVREVEVPFGRPRRIKQLNQDAAYLRLRTELIGYLESVRKGPRPTPVWEAPAPPVLATVAA